MAKTEPNNPETCQTTFLHMRERWKPSVDLMPFFEYCAGHFDANKPFSALRNYVFNPGLSQTLCILPGSEIVSWNKKKNENHKFIKG